MTEDMTIIAEEAYSAAREILEKAKPEVGELFVVGCSTSEVGGASIGTYSSPELAEVVFGGIYQATQEAGVYLAAQCCEHLNRALILEKEAAVKYGYPMVNVVPQPKAGGSFATAAYKANNAISGLSAPSRRRPQTNLHRAIMQGQAYTDANGAVTETAPFFCFLQSPPAHFPGSRQPLNLLSFISFIVSVSRSVKSSTLCDTK